MSDIFENDIDDDSEDLSSLEDNYSQDTDSEEYVFPKELYKLRLAYSFEGIYATVPQGMKIKTGDDVIIPTRYGLDLAKNLGPSKSPVGIKPSDVVEIARIANKEDLEKAGIYNLQIASTANAKTTNSLQKWVVNPGTENEIAYSIEPNSYTSRTEDGNGYTCISYVLPVNNVAKSLLNKKAFEPVIYISYFSSA